MRAMDSMRQKLLPLRLYRMDGGSLVEAELSAAAAGLDLIYERLEQLMREAFVPTAQDLGLSVRERIFGSERGELSAAVRREMLLYRGAVTVNDNNRESIERALLSCGLRAQLFENPRAQRLDVVCHEILDQTMTQYRLMQTALRFLPAHLEIVFDFGKITWAYLLGLDKTFAQLEEYGLTWEEIFRRE